MLLKEFKKTFRTVLWNRILVSWKPSSRIMLHAEEKPWKMICFPLAKLGVVGCLHGCLFMQVILNIYYYKSKQVNLMKTPRMRMEMYSRLKHKPACLELGLLLHPKTLMKCLGYVARGISPVITQSMFTQFPFSKWSKWYLYTVLMALYATA